MNTEIVPFTVPRGLATIAANAPAVFLPNAKGAERFFDFFTSNIRNKNTRRAYYKAACRFSDWCEGRGVRDLADVKPMHVAAFIEILGLPEPQGQGLSKPTVKQHLAALRMVFDWLVVGHVLDTNPAHAVRGPKFSQKKGRTRVLDRDEDGSNCSTSQINSNERLCGDAKFIDIARTDRDFELAFDVHSKKRGCAASDI